METSFVDQLSAIISSISSVVWGVPMVALIMSAGLVLSIRNKFVQFRGLGHSAALISGKYDKEDDAGELTHFQALTAALAATVGIGNIAFKKRKSGKKRKNNRGYLLKLDPFWEKSLGKFPEKDNRD